MTPSQGRELTYRLAELAKVNLAEFRRSPALCAAYAADMREKRFRYVDDKLTCGRDDCWSSYRALLERYPRGGSSAIMLDCEDASTAHSAWLSAQCYRIVWVGLVPGERVSHAVSGVSDPRVDGGKIRPVDPCVWWGMGPFGRPYEPAFWAIVSV